MHVNTHVDVDVVAIEQDDEVSVMLELSAPAAVSDTPRPPAAVQVVLDRSGSMAGERLDAAKQALVRLVDRLDPGDHFGVVAFDDEVRVVVPAGVLSDKRSARQAIAAVGAGGSTNLSGGLLRGFQEARRAAGDSGSTVLVLSDGHVTAGERDPARLASVAANARDHAITTSTVGIGLDYDELLLGELARGGQGNHVFAEHGDGAAAAVAGEVEGLLSKTVQAASLLIRPDVPVESVTLWNDLPVQPIDGAIMVELGDLWAGEERKLVLTFAVPAKPALGLARIAELELRYVALPQFAEQTVTIPVHVNVVPGDQAAGRIPGTKVRTEIVYQQVQEAKRQASDALREGDGARRQRLRRSQRPTRRPDGLVPVTGDRRGARDHRRASRPHEVRGALGGQVRADGAHAQAPSAGVATPECENVRSWPPRATPTMWADTTTRSCLDLRPPRRHDLVEVERREEFAENIGLDPVEVRDEIVRQQRQAQRAAHPSRQVAVVLDGEPKVREVSGLAGLRGMPR